MISERVPHQDIRFWTSIARRASHEFGMWRMEREFEILQDYIKDNITDDERDRRKKELNERSPWDGKGLSWKQNGGEKQHV